MPNTSYAVNLTEKYALFSGHWSPKIVASLNDYHVKIAKVEGRFPWHSHEETDELFLVVKGKLSIDIRGPDGEETIELGEGELYVVPRGVEHAPHAAAECQILVLEPAGTVNTGDAEDADMASTTGEWI